MQYGADTRPSSSAPRIRRGSRARARRSCERTFDPPSSGGFFLGAAGTAGWSACRRSWQERSIDACGRVRARLGLHREFRPRARVLPSQAVEIPEGAARRRCGMSCKAPKPRPGWAPGLLGQRRRSPAAPAPEGLVQNRALAAPRILRGRPARAAIRRTPIIPISRQRDPLRSFNSLLAKRAGRVRRPQPVACTPAQARNSSTLSTCAA